MSDDNEYMTMSSAGKFAHVTRQAIFRAIKKGNLTAEKKGGKWYVKKSDLDLYRLNKYNRDMYKIEGEYVFDMEKGHFSVQQVCRVFSATLGHPFPVQRLYYLLRTGQIKSFRKGRSWIIDKESAIALLEDEMEKEGITQKCM